MTEQTSIPVLDVEHVSIRTATDLRNYLERRRQTLIMELGIVEDQLNVARTVAPKRTQPTTILLQGADKPSMATVRALIDATDEDATFTAGADMSYTVRSK